MGNWCVRPKRAPDTEAPKYEAVPQEDNKDEPWITHRFTQEAEAGFVKELYSITTILPTIGQFVVQYAALCPGESPDRQVFSAAVSRGHMTTFTDVKGVVKSEQIPTRAFTDGVHVMDNCNEPFIAVDEPHIRCKRQPVTAMSQYRALDDDDYSTTTGTFNGNGFTYRKNDRSDSKQTKVAHVPFPYIRDDHGSWTAYRHTHTYAFFFRIPTQWSDALLWASPWCEEDDPMEYNSGFEVIVLRDDKSIGFPASPLYEIEKGRYVQVVTDFTPAAEVFEYRFDDKPKRSRCLVQRTLQNPQQPYPSCFQLGTAHVCDGKLIFVGTYVIGVMFFAADTWSFRSYSRHDPPYANPQCNLVCAARIGSRQDGWEYVCGDWLVTLHQTPDGLLHLSRLSLNTRHLSIESDSMHAAWTPMSVNHSMRAAWPTKLVKPDIVEVDNQ